MPHVFVMDNLDWRKKTLEGVSYNATTAIIIENLNSSDYDQHPKVVAISTSTPVQSNKRLFPSLPTIYITAKDRQISRSPRKIMDVDSLHTQADRTSEDMLLVQRLGS